MGRRGSPWKGRTPHMSSSRRSRSSAARVPELNLQAGASVQLPPVRHGASQRQLGSKRSSRPSTQQYQLPSGSQRATGGQQELNPFAVREDLERNNTLRMAAWEAQRAEFFLSMGKFREADEHFKR